MKLNSLTLNGNNIALGILGVLGALLVFARLTGSQIPLIAGDRAAFVVLLIIGITMCALGPLRHIQPTEWAHPMNVVATVLGSLALLLGTMVLVGIPMPLVGIPMPLVGIPMPLISSDRTALVALAIIIVSKVVFVGLHHLLLKG